MHEDSDQPTPAGDPPATVNSESAEKKKPDPEIMSPQLDSKLRSIGVNPEDPKVRTAIEISLMAYRGSFPLPPPPILAELEQLHPGITAKIIEWTEDQSAHRKAQEIKRTDRDERRKDRGQIIAAGIAGYGLTLAAGVGVWGNPWVASVLAVVSIGGPLAALVLAIGLGLGPKKPEAPTLPKPEPQDSTAVSIPPKPAGEAPKAE